MEDATQWLRWRGQSFLVSFDCDGWNSERGSAERVTKLVIGRCFLRKLAFQVYAKPEASTVLYRDQTSPVVRYHYFMLPVCTTSMHKRIHESHFFYTNPLYSKILDLFVTSDCP